MNNAKLFLMGLLATGVAVTGCTTHMARNDAAEIPADTATPAGDSAPASQPSGDTAAAPAAAATAPAADAAANPSALPTPMTDADTASAAAAPLSTDTAPPAAAGATPAADPQAAAAQPAGEDAAKQAAALLPLPPAEVTDTINKLTHHPRVRYLSGTAQYDYYVGGRLDAKYDINSNQLIVTGASDADQVKCKYGKDGTMVSDGAVAPEVVGACNALINELGGYLSH